MGLSPLRTVVTPRYDRAATADHRSDAARAIPVGVRRPPVPRHGGVLARALRRHGWRVWAFPVLTVVTVLAILQMSHNSQVAAAPMTSETVTTVISGVVVTTTVQQPAATVTSIQSATGSTLALSGQPGPDPSGARSAATPVGELPSGAAFTANGKGTWHVVPGTTAAMGRGPKVVTYAVEVEDGVGSAATDREFAAKVDATLADRRSWIAAGTVTIRRVDHGNPSFRVSLTSQLTVRNPALCGWDIPLEASCYSGQAGRVVINIARWTRGAVSFRGDLGAYREYAVNHEVGHALGHHHQPCDQNGGLAPVMMQQSWSTSDDDLATLDPHLIPPDHKVCRYNPYPYPQGVAAVATTGGPGSTAGGNG